MTPLQTFEWAQDRLSEYMEYEQKLLAHPNRPLVQEKVIKFFEGLVPALKSAARQYPECKGAAEYYIACISTTISKYGEDNGVK